MPDVQPSAIAGVFHRPFDEQVAFFRAKLGKLVPTRFWDDLKKAQHDRAFMVAGASKAELLQDLAQAVDRAISEGQSIDAFRKDFFAIVQRHGWTGYTGSGTAGGRAWRTRVIYTTNAQVSYAAGRLAQLRAAGFSLWVYRHNDSVLHPRPWHLAWNGLTLAPTDPFWKQHYPPSGWGCRCYVVGARNTEDAKLLGGEPDKEIPPGTDTVDPKTGEPVGIDEGWGYMPGDTVSDAVRVAAQQTQQWDYTLAKAYMQGVLEDTRDALATAYRDLPSVADDTRRYVQRVLDPATPADIPPYRTLGLATSKQAATIKRVTGTDVKLFDYAIDRSAVIHIRDQHGDAAAEGLRGQQAVTAADYASLPALLNAPDSIREAGTSRVGHHVVQLVKVMHGVRFVAAFEIRAGRRMLALQSFWKGKP